MTTVAPIKYILYARKSQESEERQIQSLPSQLTRLRELATQRGFAIVAELFEAHSARRADSRQVFVKMLDMIRMGQVQGILCWDLSRLSRNPEENGVLSGMLQRGELRSIQTIDREYRTGDNVMSLSVELAMANQYLLDLIKNVNRGFDDKLAAGGWPCRAPIGYLNDRLAKPRRIIIDPERFPLIKRAWELALTGNYSIRAIGDRLNSEWGFRSRSLSKKGSWAMSVSGLYSLFSNPFYAGIVGARNRPSRPGLHEPMVTLEEFEHVQRIFNRPDRPRRSKRSFLYSKLFRCGECGGMITAEVKTKRQKNGNVHCYQYYHCSWRKGTNRCTQRSSIPEGMLTARIAKALGALQIAPGFRDYVLRAATKGIADDKAGEVKRKAHQKAASDLRLQLDRTIDLCSRGIITEVDLVRRRALLQRDLDNHTLKARIGGQQELRLQRVERAFTFLMEAPERFLEDTPEGRRDILTRIGSNLLIKDENPSISLNKWCLELLECQRRWQQALRVFEPAGTPHQYKTKGAFAPEHSAWWTLANEVLTIFDTWGKQNAQVSQNESGGHRSKLTFPGETLSAA